MKTLERYAAACGAVINFNVQYQQKEWDFGPVYPFS